MKTILLLTVGLMVLYSFSCNSVAQFSIEEPTTDTFNDGLIGKWKFEEDSNKNNYYKILRGGYYHSDSYHIMFYDRGGRNPTIETNIHMTKLGGNIFISVPYLKGKSNLGYSESSGFFFLKVIDINKDFTKMTTCTVHDSTMWELNAAGIRQRILRNIDNPKFYFDTVHFFKVD